MNKDDKDFRDSATFITRSCYTFTLSPTREDWTEEKYLTMWADIKMNALTPASDYLIIPEFKEGRLHFHGVIRFSCKGHIDAYFDGRFRYKKVLRKYGSVFHSHFPKKKWIEYMWKEWPQTQREHAGISVIRKDQPMSAPHEWELGYVREDEDEELIAEFQSKLIQQMDDDIEINNYLEDL